MSLVDFIDWLGKDWGGVFVFPILFGAIGRPLYTLCVCVYFCASFGVFIQFALIKKDKNSWRIHTVMILLNLFYILWHMIKWPTNSSLYFFYEQCHFFIFKMWSPNMIIGWLVYCLSHVSWHIYFSCPSGCYWTRICCSCVLIGIFTSTAN